MEITVKLCVFVIMHKKQTPAKKLLIKLTISKFSCCEISAICRSMISLVNVPSKATVNMAAKAIADGL